MNEHIYTFSSLLKNTVPEKRRALRKYFRNNPDFKIPINSCTTFDVLKGFSILPATKAYQPVWSIKESVISETT